MSVEEFSTKVPCLLKPFVTLLLIEGQSTRKLFSGELIKRGNRIYG
jgi:hypothetical protein